MPALLPMPRGPASVVMLALLWGCACGAALAGEHAPVTSPSAAPKAAASEASAAASTSTSVRARDAKSPEAQRAPKVETLTVPDPMERLRARLAQRLGALSAPDPAHPNVLRIVSKGSAPAAPEPGATPAATSHAAHHKPVTSGATHAAAHPVHWDYSGQGGPDRWGGLESEYATCAKGTRQSPIDIRDGIKVELEPIRFDYQPGSFGVIDNGHTVQVNVGSGSSIEVMGRRYALVQFHFHRPSEERIDGKLFDMVVHLVHRDSDGHLAVVAVLLERGSAQEIVQRIWNNLPLEQGTEVAARGTLDLNELLPAERSYYTYMGSLTTPPCSEGVLWMVMKTPVPISAEQIAIFAHLYPMNARPIQPAGGRLIKESN